MNKVCQRCGGTGIERTVEDDVAEGKNLKAMRQKAGITLRTMAKAIGYTPSYLSDLEHGRRRWHPGVRAKYLRSIDHE